METSFRRRLGYAVIALAMLLSLVGNPAIMFAAEQEDITFESVYLSVRPEYDFPPGWTDTNVPALLVIHIAELINNTNEPITALSYPAPIDEPNFLTYAIGKLQEQGQYWPAPYVLSEGQIHIDLKEHPILPNEDYSLTVQYYYNPFVIEGERKSIAFEFAPEFTVDEVRVDIQLPPAGKSARIEPAKYVIGAQGGVLESNVNANNPISIDIAYDKADNNPTKAPTNRVAQGASSSGNTMLWGFVILLLIIAFVFFFVIKSKPEGNQNRQKKQNKQEFNKKTAKESKMKTQNTQQVKKVTNDVNPTASEEQKELRRQLIAGQIDENTYKEEMKKINR